MTLRYEILIPTIPHRHDMLCSLLAHLDKQMTPGAGVRLFRSDYGDPPLHSKFQMLMESSQADYVSWLDDDDSVVSDFIPTVMKALKGSPDYVGFFVEWSSDKVVQMPIVEHSLRNNGWVNADFVITRDITALNPIKRDLALRARWEPPDHGADFRWAQQLRDSYVLTTEVFVSRIMYYYRFRSTDSFLTPRQSWGPKSFPELPVYPWLEVM